LTGPADTGIVGVVPDPQPEPDRRRESYEQRERRYQLIADAVGHGADPGEIARALRVSRRWVIPMIGAARRWQARRDAADADIREALRADQLYELCYAVDRAGGPVAAEQLSSGPLGASAYWTTGLDSDDAPGACEGRVDPATVVRLV
jgi:hypothetical protein